MKWVKKMIWGIVIIVSLIGIDQITKAIARNVLKPKHTVAVIDNFFSFTYVENTGGAWGTLAGELWIFIIITIIALGIFGYLMKNFDLVNNKVYSIGLSLMVAGTIGNFLDRLIFKYVTDFLDFNFFGWDFPVFNVADICLTVGVVFMMVYVFFFSSGKGV